MNSPSDVSESIPAEPPAPAASSRLGMPAKLGLAALAVCALAALFWPRGEATFKEPGGFLYDAGGRAATIGPRLAPVTLVHFWATWCPPCIEELPSLNQFAREFAPQGVVVLGVSIDRNPEIYSRFLERNPIAFETSRDPEGDISGSYGTFQVPETYLIDRTGKVIEKVISNQNWMDPTFLARVRQML